MSTAKKQTIHFSGHNHFRRRLVLATLSGLPVRIDKIRSDDVEPGVKDYEVSFLRLLESVTNGSVFEISYTGTTVVFKPGIIVGGSVTHNCPLSRGVGYFIEPLLLLAPFGKKALTATLRGITSHSLDPSPDAIRTSIFPVMQKFGIERQELKIIQRGATPLGGGEVMLHLPHLVLHPKTLHATTTPTISKIRGIAYSCRVSPASVNRLIDGAREELRATGCETFIFSDVARGDESGKSPGFGIVLVGETRPGFCISAESVAVAGSIPEDLGRETARKLMEEISRAGVFGRNQLDMAIIFMILGSGDVGRLVIGKENIDERFIGLARDIKKFWGVEMRLKEDDENENEMICTVKGVGFVSASKKIA
ncbi:RNA 3'-terminal phosphate cyclase-like protein [Yarrowia sp. C11]|nr:RNA 3'-terminal phosphate cyclase-like protein [Yarrowia sp. C11]